MMGPVAALAKVRGSSLRERPTKNLDTFEITVVLILLACTAAAWWNLPFSRIRMHGQTRLSVWVLIALMVPAMFLGAVIIMRYRRWKTRGTVPFEFPLQLALPRWRILEQDAAAQLTLTDTEGVLHLIHRPEPGESLEQVLDAFDPDNELVVDEDTSKGDVLRFELEGTRPAAGLLRRCGDRSYLLVLVPPRRIDDLSGLLGRARARLPGEPPQKWRTLSAADVVVTKRA